MTLTPEQEARRKSLGSPRQTCAVFEELLRQWQRLGRTLRQTDLLVCAPADTLGGRRVALRQKGSELGTVLRNAVDDAFRLGYRKVLLIGNDAPGLSADYIAAAIRRIQSREPAAVLGPAFDGGFVLLGLNSNDDRLFREIDWGTGLVAEQITMQLSASGYAVRRLPRLQDIDDSSSLRITLASGSSSGAAQIAPAVCNRLRRIFEVLSFVDGIASLPPLKVPGQPGSSLRAPPA